MHQKTKKILVCDDDQSIAELVKTILDQNQFKTKLLFNGKGILKRIKEFMPDLILLDLWMPGIHGQETVKLIKADGVIKDIPVIIFSALNEVEKETKDSGADGYILKPFDIDQLLEVIRKYT